MVDDMTGRRMQPWFKELLFYGMACDRFTI